MDYLSIPEEDLPVIYGPLENPDVDKGEALHHFRYLLNDIDGVKEKFFRLGFHLAEFRRYLYYLDLGFSSLEEFALVNLNMDKTAVSRCIGVYMTFNAANDVTISCGVETHGAGINISDKYKDYSYSQLVEMLSMDPGMRNFCTPDMTVSQLRDLKKNAKKSRETLKDDDDVSQVATSQHLNHLCVTDICDLRGAALKSRIRSVDPVRLTDVLFFDVDGSRLDIGGRFAVLISSENYIYFRRLPSSASDESFEIV